ncbi:holo-ACP synthase [Endozoicomonas sp. GU-1]|uniref:holo-ACP synthase n=1 Tax=Endozoicomonas sp. GU-1 TaxID=3009078 RepID=UPI0022B45EB7|nr:holo-ACP synthase [Endozoicomonas sp. GU-1]WBA83640.1 holo-ACP synthase [Endozoicomonas sp. GU-1]WBA86618.1 holo-ACP synthase [Endozoicomonas sp. GU-1]
MIVGIGTDIVRIDRIERSLSRLGEAFARRILTDHELSQWQQRSSSPAWLAKRFAAKEAVAKAFGTGIGKLSFRHIEVRNNASGAPELFLSDYGLELQQQRGVKRLHLSLSDEQDNAIAFVVLES